MSWFFFKPGKSFFIHFKFNSILTGIHLYSKQLSALPMWVFMLLLRSAIKTEPWINVTPALCSVLHTNLNRYEGPAQ